VGRFVLLSKLEETLVVNGERFELSANQYPGVVHPQGYQYLSDAGLGHVSEIFDGDPPHLPRG